MSSPDNKQKHSPRRTTHPTTWHKTHACTHRDGKSAPPTNKLSQGHMVEKHANLLAPSLQTHNPGRGQPPKQRGKRGTTLPIPKNNTPNPPTPLLPIPQQDPLEALSHENIQSAQKQDTFCSQLYKFLINKKLPEVDLEVKQILHHSNYTQVEDGLLVHYPKIRITKAE